MVLFIPDRGSDMWSSIPVKGIGAGHMVLSELYIYWGSAWFASLRTSGERVALLVSSGFRDLLHIGNQSRPNIFDLEIKCVLFSCFMLWINTPVYAMRLHFSTLRG